LDLFENVVLRRILGKVRKERKSKGTKDGRNEGRD
jgi:predicted transposase YdaD